jgi:hypothetical protein
MKKYTLFIFALLIAAGLNAESVINFSHRLHIEDVEMECASCHAGVAESISGKDDLYSFDHESCGECHTDAIEEDCEMCHNNLDEMQLPRITDLMPDFSHKLHLSSKASCESCHSGISEKESDDPATVDAMPKSCIDCHTAMEAIPVDHKIHWVSLHGKNTNDIADPNCASCHTQGYCIACHEGDNTDFTIHPQNYEMLHAADYRTERKDCSVCHHSSNFCVDCHRINAVRPMNHNSSQWVRVPNGGSHGIRALSRIEYCQVCHETEARRDPICADCHH